MRENKFRVKIKRDAGVYHIWAIDWLNEKILVERNCGNEWVAFNKIQALMQFTGLLDKQGKEIYEGDKIRANFQTVKSNIPKSGVIVYDEYMFGIADDNDGEAYSLNRLNNVEIIGNIYEDSELLEQI